MDEVGFYRDDSNEWRWRRIDLGNHKKVGASSEGYINFEDVVDNAERINGPESSELKYRKITDE